LMPIKIIFFDMDGVLVDSHDAWFEAAKSLLRMWNEDITVEEFNQRCWGIPFGSAWRRNGMPIENMKVAAEMLHREYLKQAEKVRLFDGVAELFAFLKSKSIKTALMTNTPKWVAEKVADRLGLRFDAFPDLTQLKPKPNPDGILVTLKSLDIEKREAVMVGDTPTDEQTGRSAGVAFVMVGRDIKSVAELPGKLGL
ncbi:MAG: HAD family hydrolase, partial [Candidatus Aenigmarchaeota archaeon]|nr:HAD family hydrolase [Candidatus Aenigmarchaeota archaeon]